MANDFEAALKWLDECGSAGFIFEVGEDVIRTALQQAQKIESGEFVVVPRAMVPGLVPVTFTFTARPGDTAIELWPVVGCPVRALEVDRPGEPQGI